MDLFNSRIILPTSEIPKEWINILPDLPTPMTPLVNPADGKPASPELAMRIFAKECVLQEISQENSIPIPNDLRAMYASIGRPTPLHRAYRLEKELGLEGDNIKIFYKNESVSPTGSHKLNTALAQAYFCKKQGINEMVTETGAGQWGSALALACNLFGIKCTVYMVRISFLQKPGRKILMKIFNAKVHASPSEFTESGRRYWEKDNNHNGSLGLAISEAIEHCLRDESIRYSLGSVVNHVLLHQTVIGQEAKSQLSKIGEYPDIVIGCAGGGSNFAGTAIPFIREKIRGVYPETEMIAVEPRACPSMCKGKYMWDYGDTAKMAPIVKMYTLGHNFIPSPIHAGGLRYHGMAPILSILLKNKVIKTVMHHQTDVIQAGLLFAKTEYILPAPETCHAIKEAIDQALKAKKNKEKKTILFNFSGHGFFDLLAYKEYMDGALKDYEMPTEEIEKALSAEDMPKINEAFF